LERGEGAAWGRPGPEPGGNDVRGRPDSQPGGNASSGVTRLSSPTADALTTMSPSGGDPALDFELPYDFHQVRHSLPRVGATRSSVSASAYTSASDRQAASPKCERVRSVQVRRSGATRPGDLRVPDSASAPLRAWHLCYIAAHAATFVLMAFDNPLQSRAVEPLRY